MVYTVWSKKARPAHVPRCMEWERGLATRKVPVCPSVRQTRDLWHNERKLYPHSYTTWKTIILVLWQEEWLVGATLLPEILG